MKAVPKEKSSGRNERSAGRIVSPRFGLEGQGRVRPEAKAKTETKSRARPEPKKDEDFGSKLSPRADDEDGSAQFSRGSKKVSLGHSSRTRSVSTTRDELQVTSDDTDTELLLLDAQAALAEFGNVVGTEDDSEWSD